MPTFPPLRIAIIGVGLIGGSLALALRPFGVTITGAGRSRENLDLALELGVIDHLAATPAAAVADADLVVLAVPVGATAEVMRSLSGALDGQVITDVGSVKAEIAAAATEILGTHAARFVPGHPVAGKEHSGVRAAAGGLFAGHNVVLTPQPHTAADALALVRRMWLATGARVCQMDAAHHDRVLSLTSHLPHVLAYAMVDFLANSQQPGEDPAAHLAHCLDMAAGGFYDFTRTAASEPAMWRDICLLNRAPLLADIDRFTTHLAALRALVDTADGEALRRLFADAKTTRSQVVERRR